MASDVPETELLGHAARAVESLKQHNQEAVEYLRRPIAELQARVEMLTDVIGSVASGSGENIRRLEELKGQLLSTTEIKEIRLLKARLSQYLEKVLAEAVRQRAETERAAKPLTPVSRQLASVGSGEGLCLVDAATGFPRRVQAEDVIAQSCQDGATAVVVVMVVNQVEHLSRTFGSQFGDVMLQHFSALVRKELPPVDQLFRWSGPTLVALVRRRNVLDARGAIGNLLLQRLTLKVANPDIQVPISCRWTILPLMASPRLLFRKIDSFAGIETSEMDS